MIRFSHVTKTYSQGWVILDNVSFFMNKGEFACLYGPSGSGKSTLFKLIIMEEFPNTGEVTVMQYKSTNISVKRIARLRQELGIIFQDFRLLEDRSVFENIALPMRIKGPGQQEIKNRVLKIVTEVGLNHKMNDLPRTLSSGEKQRCCIARALVCNPAVILADEPTGYLDDESTNDIMNLLRDINRNGTAILLATHNNELVAGFKGRVITLNNGQITSHDAE
jgi:cell division transport system ATP-binding protein